MSNTEQAVNVAFEELKSAVFAAWDEGEKNGMLRDMMLADMTDYISEHIDRESTAMVLLFWDEWIAKHDA